jgi:hypothetical protein
MNYSLRRFTPRLLTAVVSLATIAAQFDAASAATRISDDLATTIDTDPPSEFVEAALDDLRSSLAPPVPPLELPPMFYVSNYGGIVEDDDFDDDDGEFEFFRLADDLVDPFQTGPAVFVFPHNCGGSDCGLLWGVYGKIDSPQDVFEMLQELAATSPTYDPPLVGFLTRSIVEPGTYPIFPDLLNASAVPSTIWSLTIFPIPEPAPFLPLLLGSAMWPIRRR